MEREYNVTRVQLTSWNSQFDSQCLFIERWRWTTVCVGYVERIIADSWLNATGTFPLTRIA